MEFTERLLSFIPYEGKNPCQRGLGQLRPSKSKEIPSPCKDSRTPLSPTIVTTP